MAAGDFMKTVRIAVAVWQSRVSPVFDTAGKVLILDIGNGRELYRAEQSIRGLSMQKRVDRLVELDVDVLVCGAISRQLADMLAASGIKVIPWVRGNVDEVLQWYSTGQPMDLNFLMPGCPQKRHRFRGMRGRRAMRDMRDRRDYPEERL
jgi:predicted Fe-Mo cluster-binding NifX family protein